MNCNLLKKAFIALFCASAWTFASSGLAANAAKFVGSTITEGQVPSDFGTY